MSSQTLSQKVNPKDLQISIKHWSKWSERTRQYAYDHLTLQRSEFSSYYKNMPIECLSTMKIVLHSTAHYDYTLVIVRKNRKAIASAVLFKNESGTHELMIYVKQDFRRQGIGRFIFDAAKKFVKKSGHSALYIHPWDTTSRNFYSSLVGFETYWPQTVAA